MCVDACASVHVCVREVVSFNHNTKNRTSTAYIAFFFFSKVQRCYSISFSEISTLSVEKCLYFFNLLVGIVYVLILEIFMSKNMHAAVICACLCVCACV